MCFKLLLFKVKTTAQIREHQIIFGHEVTSQNFREQCRRRIIIIIVGSDCQSTRPVQQNHNKSANDVKVQCQYNTSSEGGKKLKCILV